MDKDLQYKIQDLQIRLNSYDVYAKRSVCDEFLNLIKESENVDLKAELCRMVVLCLVDLDRDSDVIFCMEILMGHEDYHSYLAALSAKANLCARHNDVDGQIDSYSTGIQIALDHSDDIALSQGYRLRGKALLAKGNVDEALADLNRLIPIAERSNDYNIIAVATYYIALALEVKGFDELCLQKLREASELARRQHCQSIVMQTEVVRARIQMKLGRTDVAERILDDWTREFSLML